MMTTASTAMTWARVLSLGMCLLGCGKPPLTPPSQGGEPWVEVKSNNFRVVSDLSETQASDVLGSLEETYALLGEAVFNGRSVPSFTTNALVFRSASDLRQFVGDGVGGQYLPWLPNDLEPAPTVLAWGSLSPFARLLFAHELTHRFNHVALGPTPPWLNEGLAEYYSTIRGEEGKPIMGEIDPRYMCVPDGLGDLSCYQYERLSRTTLPSASEIVGMDRQAFYSDTTDERGIIPFEQKRTRQRHYAISWLLVHMLMHAETRYAERFRYVLALIPDGTKGEKLAQVVEEVDEEVLNRDLADYLGKKIPWRQHHAKSPQLPATLNRRVLPESELLVLWARLDAFKGEKGGRAERHLQLASRSAAVEDGAPSFWLGRYSALRGNAVAAEASYRRSLELDPGNPEYLYGLLELQWGNREGAAWEAAGRSPEVGATVAALLPTARTATQLNAVAAHQLLTSNVPVALSSSARACKLDSSCWPCFHNHAAALFASGDAEMAARTEGEALSRLPEGAPQALARQMTQARAFYLAASADPDQVAGRPRPSLFAP